MAAKNNFLQISLKTLKTFPIKKKYTNEKFLRFVRKN